MASCAASPLGRHENLAAIRDDVTLLRGDLVDQMTLLDAISRSEPDELHNLAATSFVPASWRQPVMTAQFTAVGATAILITNPGLRYYQASSSETFGATNATPQRRSPVSPQSGRGGRTAAFKFHELREPLAGSSYDRPPRPRRGQEVRFRRRASDGRRCPKIPRIHANAMAAHGGPYDLTLEFAYRADPSDAPAAQILVTMSWEHAAAMAKSLRALVDSYEQRVGRLPDGRGAPTRGRGLSFSAGQRAAPVIQAACSW